MFRVNLIVILQQFGGGVEELQSLRKEAALWSSGMAADTSVYFIFSIVSNIFMLLFCYNIREISMKRHITSATQIYLGCRL